MKPNIGLSLLGEKFPRGFLLIVIQSIRKGFSTMKLLHKIKKSKLITFMYMILFKLTSFLPVKKNVVMFESFYGKQYSDNPRAIYEYMSNHCPEYTLYWSAHKDYLNTFKKHNIPYVKRFSVKWLFYMARAQYWVSNSRLPLWIPKPKHTIYLQTWHGTPLKKLAVDVREAHVPVANTKKYKQDYIKEARKWDYLISANKYSTEIFRRAFNFQQTMLECGYPRNDFLFEFNNDQSIKQLKKKLEIPVNKKVILYAPTWRDNQYYEAGRYKFSLNIDLTKMKEELADDYVIILRTHYLVAEQFDLSDFAGFVYDFSHREDIRELYVIADILITDYSSVFFDFANLKRPMIFFVYDIEEYRDKLRGFYFDFEKNAPGLLTKSTDDIIAEVKRIDRDGFIVTKEIEQFYEKFCYLEDGQATKRVVEDVFQI